MANPDPYESGLLYSPILRVIGGMLMLLVLGAAVVLLLSPSRFFDDLDGVVSADDQAHHDLAIAEVQFAAAADAARDGDWSTARKCFVRADLAIGPWTMTFAKMRVHNTVYLKDWYDTQILELTRLLQGQVDPLLQQVVDGTVSVDEADRLVNAFSEAGFKPLQEYFAIRRQVVSSSQSNRAQNWLRVRFETLESAHFNKAIIAELRQKWVSFGDYQLVFDDSLGTSEQLNTWKTLRIGVDTDWTSITIPMENVADDPRDYAVTFMTRLRATFVMESTDAMPSSWDALPVIEINRPVPKRYVGMQRGSREIVAAVREKAKENGEAILAALNEQLDDLPAFSLFPNVDLTRSLVTMEGQLDQDLAYALAVSYPARFEREVELQVTRSHPDLIASVCEFLVRNRLMYHRDWLCRQLPSLERGSLIVILSMLENNPELGGYSPLMAIAEKGPSGAARKALEILLRAALSEDQYSRICQAITRADESQRLDMGIAFLRGAPAEQLDNVTEWMVDPNVDFAIRAAAIFRERRPELANQYLVKQRERLDPQTLIGLLGGYRFDGKTDGEPELDMLRWTVDPARPENVRKAGRFAFERATQQRPGWEAYAALIDKQASVLDTFQMRRVLLDGAMNALEDDAVNWLLGQVDAYQKLAEETLSPAARQSAVELRDYAIIRVTSRQPPSPRVFAALAELLRQHPTDADLVQAVLKGMSDVRRLPTWSWALDGLSEILEIGGRQDDLSTRKQTYELLAYAVNSNSGKSYRPRLDEALKRESDPALQTYLRNLQVP